MTQRSKKALFAGSFNPFTTGHADIVERGLELFDRVVIAIGYNIAKGEGNVAEREATLRELYADEPRVEIVTYSGLTVDLAKRMGCDLLLRGVRSVADFEYERNLADINRKISGLETVMLMTRPELACVSSSAVRELVANGYDVTEFLPTGRS